MVSQSSENFREGATANRQTHRIADLSIREVLDAQLSTAWALAKLHLSGLRDEECLWRPAARGPHVVSGGEGWTADWPEDESYSAGPPSIAWLTWHMGFWWSMVHNHSFGDRSLAREDVRWPGSADAARKWLDRCHADWRAALEDLDDSEFASSDRASWPFSDRPFAHIVAWVNGELMKNTAELGYVRYLYGSKPSG